MLQHIDVKVEINKTNIDINKDIVVVSYIIMPRYDRRN
jgi:hypothetical protein